ncbi:hypothetical protein FIE12Z_11466 [Fusarium flagelliforme]|uniref:Uncharacterized protein n=1 Tax=Fusarium flagelliforme TaxID=2675880 RepID=A0A395MB19_9HYPO|nr:hypothetical protein FIE12Z_11466 [Fusarium flagelliforme]
MAPQAVVVMAPEKPKLNDKTMSVFLAGITTSTNEADWRQSLTNALIDYPVTIFNPNRPDWDGTWKEDFSDKRWEEQVSWELDMQDIADVIVFFFHKSTDAPISLLELGLAIRTKTVVVCAQNEYRKRGNVEAVCRRFGVPLLSTEVQLRDCLIDILDRGQG